MADKVDAAKKEKGEQDNSEEKAKTEMPRWDLGQVNLLKVLYTQCKFCLQVAEASLSGVRPYYGGTDCWQRDPLLTS